MSKNPTQTGKESNSRDKILEQGRRLFREKGYQGVSLNDLVNAIGVKKPTIYYYFGDKETLFAEVLISLFERGNHYIVSNLRAEMHTLEKLETLAQGYCRFSPVSLMSLVRDTQNYLSAPGQQKVKDAYIAYVVKPIEAIFADGIERQELRNLDPGLLALTFLGMIDAMTTLMSLMEGRQFDYRQISHFLSEILAEGVQHRL